MAFGTGIDGQFGLAPETVFGTFVPPVRFLEIMPGESVKAAMAQFTKTTLGGMVQRTDGVRSYSSGAAGDVSFEVATKGFGALLKQCFGFGASAQVASTVEYTQTFHPDMATGGNGVSASLQFGRPQTSGVVTPFSYVGAKVTEFEFTSELDAALQLSTTWDAVSEDTSKALGVNTLLSGSQPYIFIDATVTIGGVASCVKSLSVKGTRALATDRRCLGPVTTKKEQVANGKFEITGEMVTEFSSMAEYNKFIAGTTSALVATFAVGTIPTLAVPYQLVMTLPAIMYTGDTPALEDAGPLTLTMPFMGLFNGTNPAWEIVIHTDETAL